MKIKRLTRWLCAAALPAALVLGLAACGGGGGGGEPRTPAAGITSPSKFPNPQAKAAAVAQLQTQTPIQARVGLPAPSAGFEPMPFVNYETAHVHPVDMTADGRWLLAVNTPAATLMVFDLSSGQPVLTAQVAVGLEPVTVRARGNDEAWVVNQLSDTISRVDLKRFQVTQLIDTADEPADVVFAGPRGLAFVTASQAKTLQVFDPQAAAKPVRSLRLQGEDPRSLAVSPDGRTVYPAFYKSGNGTTTLAGGKQVLGANLVKDVLALPDTPYGGVRVPPNNGKSFKPALNPANPPPPAVSLIVRKGRDGRWRDDNGADWTAFVSGARAGDSNRVPGWDLVDRDLAVIDAESFQVSYRGEGLNINMALAVHPQSGEVSVVGTDATNEIRYEPNLNGTFVRVKMARFAATGAMTAQDLNPHLDYQRPRIAEDQRRQSIGDPRAIAWAPDGSRAWVAGMGSNNVIVLDAKGQRVARIPVGQGPTGLTLDVARSRVYVLNRFSATIDTLDLRQHTRLSQTPFFDPTPAAVREGRPLLYDTHLGSGLGQASCASCHVDGRTDKLAWDLGNPAGSMVTRRSVDGRIWNFHPMKGPLKTQTLVDIIGSVSLHHRGDKDNLAGFASSFRELQGRETDATPEEIARMERFLDSLHFGPNPFRTDDNALPTAFQVLDPFGRAIGQGNAVAALPTFMRDCVSCHIGERGRGDTGGPNQVHTEEPQAAEPLGGYFSRLGFYPASVNGSTSGFGTRHDATDSAHILLNVSSADMHALFMSWEGPKAGFGGLSRDAHAGVGRQVLLDVGGDLAAARRLIAIANSGNVGLIAKGQVGGLDRGYTYVGEGWFQGDVAGDLATLEMLANRLSKDDPVYGLREDRLSFLLVPRGSEHRMGIDADLDGLLDAQDPAPEVPQPAASWASCAVEGQTCQINGTATVRYGSGDQWLYGVFTGSMICGNGVLGDPLLGTVKRCEVVSVDRRAALPRAEVVGPGNGRDGVLITADDAFTLYVNGVEWASGQRWTQARFVPLQLQPGDVIAIRARDAHAVASGLLAEVRVGGRTYGTGAGWRVATVPPAGWASPSLDDRAWPMATVLATYGAPPWGAAAQGVPLDTPAQWIWSAPGLQDEQVVFRFRVPDPDGIRIAADDAFKLFVNGALVGQGPALTRSGFFPVVLQPEDVVAVEVDNTGGPGGLLMEVTRGGVRQVSGQVDWRVAAQVPGDWTAKSFNHEAWAKPKDFGAYGTAPWGLSVGRVPLNTAARWIWLPDAAAPKAHFRWRVPALDGVRVAADNAHEVFVNGVSVGTGSDWSRASFHGANLRSGDVVAIIVRDAGLPNDAGGLLAEISRGTQRWHSGAQWRVATQVVGGQWMRPGFDAAGWAAPTDYGAYGAMPWATAVRGWSAASPARWIWSGKAVDDNTLYARFVVP